MMRGKLAGAVRRMCGRLARFGRKEFDYRRVYAGANLQSDYWSVVGPSTQREFDSLGAVKLKHLVDLGLTPDSRILDVGCGTGLLASALAGYLSDRGSYVGADIGAEAVAFCQERFRRPNFRFVHCEATAIPLGEPLFDAIVFYSVFTHTYPDETALLLAEAKRLLAPNGFIFADAFTSPTIERCEGNRGAVVVNDEHLQRLCRLVGLSVETVMTHDGPRGSQRPFLRLRI